MTRINHCGLATFAKIFLISCATQPSQVPRVAVITKVRADSSHPLKLGENYPAESARLHEESVCIVRLTVAADGGVHDVSLTQSKGYVRLDQMCLDAFLHGGLLPATSDGKPITSNLGIPITWRIPSKAKKSGLLVNIHNRAAAWGHP